LNDRLSGKSLQLSGAKRAPRKIDGLTSGMMLMYGRDQNIACER